MEYCKRCLFNSNICTIGNLQCNYCDLHDNLEKSYIDFKDVLNNIQENKTDKYNCITGISGGIDSSTLLFAAVKKWNLRPLVIHFDNHWNTEIAKKNMNKLVTKLNIDIINYQVNKEEFDNLNKAFLKAGVPDLDVPNDVAMTKLMYETASKYNIKYILNGHCFKTEGSTPKKWTYMDSEYIQDIYKTFYNKSLTNFPLFKFSDQIKYGIENIQQVRPFYYKNIDRKILDVEMKEFIGWENYGWKHGENLYTDFVGSYLLPKKFGIDKRIVYLSAQIRMGELTKKTAMRKLNMEATFDISIIKKEYLDLADSSIKSRDNYKKFDYVKYKWVIFYLYIKNIVPYTFYIKYSENIGIECHKYSDLSLDNKQILLQELNNTNFNSDITEALIPIINSIEIELSK